MKNGLVALAFNALVVAFMLAPLVVVCLVAFTPADTLQVPWGDYSLRWFRAAWQNDQIVEALLRSLTVAPVAACLATVAATMAALATTRTTPYRGLAAKVAFLNQPLVVPEIVTAVALLVVFARIKVWTGYTGLGYLIAAHTAFCIPFAYLPIRARLETMDLTLERAAADLYARPWRVFRSVTFPLLWPGILAGFMLAFVVSLDDVVITEFVKSAGQDTLPTYMLGQLRRAVTPEMNAISTVFLGLSVVVVSLFFVISRKRN